MRDQFDRQLEELHTALIQMGALCERAIRSAVESVLENDGRKAQAARTLAEETDKKERDVEALCLKLLLHQQPVARDLRQISAALKMITDMERIGEQAGDIAEIVLTAGVSFSASRFPLSHMASSAIQMVTKSVDSYVRMDLELARWVIWEDDVVDQGFVRMKQELLKEQNWEGAEWALDLLMIAKYLEKMADHAVSIAEWVEYAITGVHRRGVRPVG